MNLKSDEATFYTLRKAAAEFSLLVEVTLGRGSEEENAKTQRLFEQLREFSNPYDYHNNKPV